MQESNDPNIKVEDNQITGTTSIRVEGKTSLTPEELKEIEEREWKHTHEPFEDDGAYADDDID